MCNFIRRLVGCLLLGLGAWIVTLASRLLEPIKHLAMLIWGSVSPSSGNMGVIAGEFAIYAGVMTLGCLAAWCGLMLIERE